MEVNKKEYFKLLELKEDKVQNKVNSNNNNQNNVTSVPLKDAIVLSSNTSKNLTPPKELFFDEEENYNKFEKIYDGVYYYNSIRTRNGGIVRALFVDVSKVNVSAEFNNDGSSINTKGFIENKNFLACINGQFFANGILLGDIKSENKIYTDKNNYDKITDNRFFISIDNNGNINYGKGGLEENITEGTKFFIGGLLRLYDDNKIYKDSYGGDSQNSSIARTFIGIDKNNKLVLITIGEGSKRNKGASFDESIEILKKLNVKTAFILDGGGSTSMIVKNKDIAKTDGRKVNSYISIYKK
ncbi:MAG: hypothetical protein KatS3mg068_0439 [Candidatus Sericytochromatia bacterium]|nr:MAG: hypothetical protein KatS3mg068_0439 [Candidatus Sericytochromatia bacterium]